MLSTIYGTVTSFIKWEMKSLRDKWFPESDFICYYGGISLDSIDYWRNNIFEIGSDCKDRKIDSIVIFLFTPGGSAAAVERMVEMTRHFYKKVYFLIPSFAMSAGTIWVMSGDKIYMNYASALGPIDPQVFSSDGKWVPALGYLDKVREIIDKSKNGTVTQAELMMLSQLDLAQLNQYEQAAELSKDLLEIWLVKYKFKDWNEHETTNKGSEVTEEEKKTRAKEIAENLTNNSYWHSHDRFIGINALKDFLKLKIDDFSDNMDLSNQVENLHRFLCDHTEKFNIPIFVQTAPPAEPPAN